VTDELHSRNVSKRRGATQVGQARDIPGNFGEVREETEVKGVKKAKLANEESSDYCSEEDDEVESC
jgi:hypothetical protein